MLWLWLLRHRIALGSYLLLVGFIPLIDVELSGFWPRLGYASFLWAVGGLVLWSGIRARRRQWP